jgi:hypothetical protein
MGYLTLGSDGQISRADQDAFTRALILPRALQEGDYNREIFPGSIELGRKKKKGFFKKSLLFKHLARRKKMFSKKGKKGKKKGPPQDGDNMAPENEGSDSAGSSFTSTEGQSQAVVPEGAGPPGASIEQNAARNPNTSGPVPEEEGLAPSPVPDSGSAPSDPTSEPPPWAKKEEEPSAPAPGEGFPEHIPAQGPQAQAEEAQAQETSHVEAEEPPQSSIDTGTGVGGWLTTEASPSEIVTYENRAPRSRLRPRKYVSVHRVPRHTATPPMWAKAFGVRKDHMGRQGFGVRKTGRQGLRGLEGPLSDGANSLLDLAAGEVSQSWAALNEAYGAWKRSRGSSMNLTAALRAANATLDWFKKDADKILIARGADAFKKLGGWLTANGDFMAANGEALDRENPALVTRLGAWVDDLVPKRNAVADGFMQSPLLNGLKAGAAEFGKRSYVLAAGIARVAGKVGTGIEKSLEGGIPWYVWLGGAVLVLNYFRK